MGISIHPVPRRGAIPSYLLTVILAALTLLSIYFGSYNSAVRSIETQKRRQSEEARRILDAMSLQWRLRDQVSIHSSKLLAKLEDLRVSGVAKIPWESLSGDIRRRIPGTRVWMFEYPASSASSLPRVTAAPTGGGIGRQAMAHAFHHLVTRHTGERVSDEEERRMAKLLPSLFGSGVESAPLAQSLRGTPVHITSEGAQQFLFWDMITDGTRPVAGFIVLAPENSRTKRIALNISAASVRNKVVRWSGFIRGHPSNIGDLFPKQLQKSRILAGWCAKFRGIPFRERERSLPPWGETLGRYRLYTRAILNSSHLAAVLLPVEPPPEMPLSLKIAGAVFAVGCLLVLTRGLLLGQWPVVPLTWRFSGLYALACALPLSIAVQTFAGYVDERREALMQSLERRLDSSLSTIDQSKDQLQSRYLAAFSRVLAMKEVREAVNRHGVKAPGLAEMMVREFSNASPSLPLSALFLFDMHGNELATSSSMLTHEQIDGLHTYYRINLINVLRQRYQVTHRGIPPGKDPLTARDHIFWDAFTQIAYSNMMQTVEMRRGIPEFFRAGSNWIVKVHDFIMAENGEMVAFLIAWHDWFLDREIIRNAVIDFSGMNPGGIFNAYRNERNRLVPLTSGTRTQRFILDRPASTSKKQGGTVALHTDVMGEWFVLARPSRTMRDVWLSAALPVKPELAAFEARQKSLLVFLWLSLSVVVLLGAVTARHVVPSIVSVKTGLTAINTGDLDVRVKLDRPDELGLLAHAFDEMTEGLRQRQRLSTFVSDAALQALSGGTTEKPRRGPGVVLVSDIRSFTALCESQPAPIITGMLNRHFDRMTEIVHRYGGRIDRFIGDAIQAVFEPRSPNDPSLEERAIRAGLAMLAGMESINADRRNAGLFSYAIGVGLCGGDLLFGGIGDPGLRFEITMFGNPVATATRLESLSKSAPGIPLVMTPEIAAACGTFTTLTAPLSGHETPAVAFKSGISLKALVPSAGTEADA